MQRVFVIDKNKKPLMPCLPVRARELLKNGKAVVIRRYPFTILLVERKSGDIQQLELKIDPGSRKTGLAIVILGKRGRKVVWAANLEHRGLKIRELLDSRRAIRRGRRARKTRYRKSRFLNRCRPSGWLPPSLQSRIGNVVTLGQRILSAVPISRIHVETVRFDTQKLENPEIEGTEYSRGTLFGYEVREYLLEKWNRQCVYCLKKDIPLEIDHIEPRSKGGSDRVSNLTIACRPCNQKKGNRSVQDFLSSKPGRLRTILSRKRLSLKDAAAVNTSRKAIGNTLQKLGLPVDFWTGGQTKFNRTKQNYKKDHWIDAACLGNSGSSVYIPLSLAPLEIKATGRGSRQFCRMDRYGFPRTGPKTHKRVQGFQTGDIVKADVPAGKKSGIHQGRVAVRSSGSFNIRTATETVQGIPARYCLLLHRCDGYNYQTLQTTTGGQRFLPALKNGVSALSIR